MRVLVICDRMAGLSPRGASEVVGRAFADEGAQVAVIPVGASGPELADSVATMKSEMQLVVPANLPELLELLQPGPGALVVDASNVSPPPLAELVGACTPEKLSEVRERLDGRNVVLVVPTGDSGHSLTGLDGRIAELGRERGADLKETIDQDNQAEAWAAAIEVDPTFAGAGALGGVGSIVLGLGGRIASGLEFCLEEYEATRVASRADVIVTGAALLDFHDLGGPLVKMLAQVSADCQRPLVAVAGRTYVSARELRTAGIEAAYSVLPGAGGEEPDSEQLLAASRKVAATWRW